MADEDYQLLMFGSSQEGLDTKCHQQTEAVQKDACNTEFSNYENVQEEINDKKFADRFRGQRWNKPRKTISSHLSKDGHYYIDPNSTQYWDFTVQETASFQTFPVSYYFWAQDNTVYEGRKFSSSIVWK